MPGKNRKDMKRIIRELIVIVRKKVFCLGMIYLVFVATILFATGLIASAEPAITEQRRYYDVTGQTLGDVNKRMLASSPIAEAGIKYRGRCDYHIDWQFTYASDSDWCAIKSVAVTISITYTMPRWIDYSSTSSSMQEKWNVFFTRLQEHEEGHANLAKDASRDIEREIGNMKRRSCQELNQAANESGHDLMRKLDAASDAYDARTNHGILQDAVLHEL
jgi:predicted secreted Zn-dependent protease